MKLPFHAVATSLGVVLILCLLAGAYLNRDFIPCDQNDVLLSVQAGDTFKTLERKLNYGSLFMVRVYARLTGQARYIHTGEYHFRACATPLDILSQVTSGQVLQHHLSLIEGWTFAQALDAVRGDKALTLDNLPAREEDIMAAIGHDGEKAEGRFFPDTYWFPRGTSATAFLGRAYDTMAQILESEWDNRAVGLPYETAYEALIAASLIEKETALPAERPIIAGVIVRRLQKRMKLQFDPSVIYALGDRYQGRLHRRDLQVKSPYNTYRNRGLPPTPIAMPGRGAIHATLHPDDSGALYFVARGDGSHVFSNDLDSHRAAVRAYREQKDKQHDET